LKRYPARAHDEGACVRMTSQERGKACWAHRSAALDLDGAHGLAGANHEVHFVRALAPVGDLVRRAVGVVQQVRPRAVTRALFQTTSFGLDALRAARPGLNRLRPEARKAVSRRRR